MTLSAIEKALNDPTLSEQERSNIQFVLKFRALPFAERSNYTVEGFRPSRMGMANLGELNTGEGPNYTADSIPDREDDILDIIAKGDRVWATWLIRGTHGGALYGIPATGNKVEVLEVGQWRIQDDLIAEAWFFVDELALVRQLGVWPEPVTAEKEN
ncbi:ester cyclase [Streptomyces sp. NPDC087263]|uniref:ester cyclase n=1 Tax=Streptomyces sp. NPDC087263 TaxID=3365773 RepID=UPI00380B3C74